ncbi:MAG: DUF885 family protein [Xanthomonadaceae bacterium]|nr:DUF885 family protein [Xanthomonadaceae bacterium]
MQNFPIRFFSSLLIAALFTATIADADATPRQSRRPTHRADVRTAPAPENKAAQLNRLYHDYWEASLKLNPLQATLQGDLRYNDQIPNFLSADYRQQAHNFTTEWLRKVETIGPEGLTGQDLLSYEIFVDDANNALKGERFPNWMMPLNPYNNIAAVIAILGSGTNAQPFNTVKDYENWAARMRNTPLLFDQAITNMRAGMSAGVTLPRPLAQKVLTQLDTLAKSRPEDTPFWMPIQNMPEQFSDADRERLRDEYRQMIDTQILPAYRKLRDFIATDYLPHTRDSIGMSGLPDGNAWYAYLVRESTTTALLPEQIHQIGLDEVSRLQHEIERVMEQVKFRGSLPRFLRHMQSGKQFQFNSDTAVLSHYEGLKRTVEARIPELFTLTPKAGLEVHAVEPARAQSAADVSYLRPKEDDNQSATLYINTANLSNQRTWNADIQFLHEGIPGHHYQLALQQELAGLPKFRRFGGEIAFTEGWGLYAGSLGKELGLYQTPYSYYGWLQDDLYRAVALVVDTGLHHQGWSIAQATQYMQTNTAIDDAEIASEIGRILAIPGQALSYKIGEMKFNELRKKAQHDLGAIFDIREFHEEVLKNGSMPLNLLEQKIDRWIADKKSKQDE